MQSQITANQIQANRGIAASVAVQTPLPLLHPGESALGFANGNYAGQSALAVSFAHGVNIGGHEAILSAGVSDGGSGTVTRAGVAFKF